MERDASRKRIFVVLACFGAVILLTNLALITGTDFGLRIEKLQMPEVLGGKPKGSMDFSDTVGLPSFFLLLLLLLLRGGVAGFARSRGWRGRFGGFWISCSCPFGMLQS